MTVSVPLTVRLVGRATDDGLTRLADAVVGLRARGDAVEHHHPAPLRGAALRQPRRLVPPGVRAEPAERGLHGLAVDGVAGLEERQQAVGGGGAVGGERAVGREAGLVDVEGDGAILVRGCRFSKVAGVPLRIGAKARPVIRQSLFVRPAGADELAAIEIAAEATPELVDNLLVGYGERVRGSPEHWTPTRLEQLFRGNYRIRAPDPRAVTGS